MNYQPIVGLEIHVELNTKSKMFCSCRNNPKAGIPNSEICPICMGHPGTLPVINEEAVKKVIKTGLALNCQIPEYSKFDRKNYFYPDLPKGYQISQYDAPLCVGGYLEIPIEKVKTVRMRRVHLEEDTGRLVHPEGADYSLVDFNRAGIPLMELVTEPELSSAKEARKFSEELRLILRYLDVSNADMEKGQMRVEANISLINRESDSRIFAKKLEKDSRVLGTKVEIKNLNSFRSVEKAIDYEIERQAKILRAGKKITHETRGWDDIKGVTVSQREKEQAHDYRYFPEPDLPMMHLGTKEYIDKIKAEISELPQQKRERLKREYELLDGEIEVFVQNKDLGGYFEKVISELEPGLPREKLFSLIKLTTNYLITDLQGLLQDASVANKNFLITPENFSEFIALIQNGKISSKIAKQVLAEMFKTGADPSHIVEEKGLLQITDERKIENIIREAMKKNQKAVLDFQKGKTNALQFLAGQVMALTKGRANPQSVNKILNRILTKEKLNDISLNSS